MKAERGEGQGQHSEPDLTSVSIVEGEKHPLVRKLSKKRDPDFGDIVPRTKTPVVDREEGCRSVRPINTSLERTAYKGLGEEYNHEAKRQDVSG